jgi:phosphatidate cytidylyltransferase
MLLGELAKRLAVAAFGVPLALGLVFLGGWPLAGAAAIIAALAAWELFRLGAAGGGRPFVWLGVGGAATLPLLAGLAPSYAAFAPHALAAVLLVLLAAAIGAVWLRWPDGRPLSSIGLTLAGVVYAGGGLSFALLLRHLPESGMELASILLWRGELLLIFPLVITWATDTAAYLFGVSFGRRKLFPRVSPGKTVLGALAGLTSATVVGAIMGWWPLVFHPDLLLSVLIGGGMGLVLGVAAQLGDLVESVLKREAGVKDSGALFPGHGGILDRFDALLFTLPLAYALIRVVEALQ